jgi:hypothetical protein
MISAIGTIETAVKATARGFISSRSPVARKGAPDAQNALRQKRLEEENVQLREKVRTGIPHRQKRHPKLRRDIELARVRGRS